MSRLPLEYLANWNSEYKGCWSSSGMRCEGKYGSSHNCSLTVLKFLGLYKLISWESVYLSFIFDNTSFLLFPKRVETEFEWGKYCQLKVFFFFFCFSLLLGPYTSIYISQMLMCCDSMCLLLVNICKVFMV